MKFELNKLISILPGHIWWKDVEGRFQGCNNKVASLLKLQSPHDIIGLTNHDLFEPEIAEELDTSDSVVFAERREIEIEELGIDANGQPAIYITRKLPLITDDEVVGLLGVSFDITDRKAHERELAIAKESAEVANHAKSSFIMNISHDIRTPLSGIIGFSKIVESTETDPVKRERLGYIVQSSERLATYLNDVIDIISSRDQFNLQKEHFSLNGLIEDCLEMFSAEVATHDNVILKADLDKNIPLQICSDRFRIEKIILNLVGNAFKFTHEGAITVNTRLLSQNGANYTISIKVSDTGIGIAKSDQDKIFGRFTRLQSSYTSKYTGYGLGLYIVKTFVEELEGSITVDSELERGTTFEFIFTTGA